MNRFFTLASLTFFLTSCSTFHYNTISSNQADKDPASGDFISENDSVKFIYNFSGRNAPLTITIQNKTDLPMYADWRRSALIIGDNVISYMGEEISIKGSTSGTGVRNGNWSFESGRMQAVASLPKESSFIPPHSQVGKKFTFTTNLLIKRAPDSSFNRTRIPDNEGTPVLVKAADFNNVNSPVKFRSYLTLVVEKHEIPQIITSDQEFYVSRIVKSPRGPQAHIEYNGNRGDQYYISKKTAYGKIMGGAGMAGLLAGVLAAEAISEDDNCQNKNP